MIRNGMLVVLVAVLGISLLQLPAYGMSTSSTTCKPDFTITVIPTTLTVVKGGPALSIGVGFKSLCGLAGTINFGVRGVSPQASTTCNNGICTSNGLVFKQCCYDLPLKANGSTGNRILVSATTNTLATTYQIRITGENIQGGCCYGITHSENVTITVASCCVASFSIVANPTSITVARGQTATSDITAKGQNGFSAQIFYSGTLSPSSTPSESCNLQPAQPTLSATVTSVTSVLSCSFSAKGTYTMFETVAPLGGSPSRNTTITMTVT